MIDINNIGFWYLRPQVNNYPKNDQRYRCKCKPGFSGADCKIHEVHTLGHGIHCIMSKGLKDIKRTAHSTGGGQALTNVVDWVT